MPTRYTHSPNEMVTEDDCNACVDLLIAFLESEPLVHAGRRRRGREVETRTSIH
ncbi:MAG: hypothetical protein R2849_20570 [Thermomicrobiales bacterium]